MIELKDVSIEDKAWIDPMLKASNHRGSDYTFANIFNWSPVFHFRVAKLNDRLLIESGEGNFSFSPGIGDISPVVDYIEEYCAANNKSFLIYNATDEDVQMIENIYPSRFQIISVRDNFDYIYERESLATLGGKKLHGKRNHIARFKEDNPNWSYESITKENIQDVIQMNKEWCEINECFHDHSLKKEVYAIKSAFDNYFELGLTGGLIRNEGRVLGFCFGSSSSDDTFVVHVEKAFSDVRGAYPMINQQFVLNELSNYQYVNREDDLGREGLRKAKESYYPAFLYPRFIIKEA